MAILFEIVVFCLSIIEVSFSQNRAAEHLLSKKDAFIVKNGLSLQQ